MPISLMLVMMMSMAILLGSIVFLSFVLAPTVFQVLDARSEGSLLRAVFPRYYGLGVICSAISLLAASVLVVFESSVVIGVCILILLALIVISAYSIRLVPRINAARDNGPPSRFETLHRRSVILNAVNLFLSLGAFSLMVLSRTQSF